MRKALVLVTIGCGSGTSGDTDAPTSYPSDPSAEGIAAYLASNAWQDPPWTAETDAPRPPNDVVSPHGDVRVWFNDVLLASVEAGNGAMGGAAHDAGSMVVKELYDDAGRIGLAAMLKVDGDARAWAYYCDGPEAPCGVTTATADPYHGIAEDAECSFCHGGLVFNAMPE